MLWNCLVNQIGNILDRYNLGGCIFADDITLAATGEINHIASTIQNALDDINNWAKKEGLKFNVSKSHAILFKQRQKQSQLLPPIFLDNQLIAYKPNIRYLGVTLNDRLRWTDHLSRVFSEAKRDMIRINKALSKTIGPSPKLTHWIYTGIIRPKITYAAHIWCGRIFNHTLEKKSRQIQRWALTKLGPIRDKTPTAGLEIITKTIPLHIHLQEISLKTIQNFINIGYKIQPAQNGHLSRWLQIIKEHIPLTLLPNDTGLKRPAPYFQNRMDHPEQSEEVAVYTDGSKMGPDCGSGFFIKWNDQTRMGLGYNGKYYTVYLSEIRAITLAVEKLLTEELPHKIVNIYSDCQSAIEAILGPKSRSKTVQQCWSLLQQLDSKHRWSLTWVKAHVGIKGNESADKLAKQATQLTFNGPQPLLPISPNHIRNAIINFSIINWDTYWNCRTDCRQTKLWFPSPNYKESKQILNLSKNDFGLITRWITGHCFLARHDAILNNGDPTCNKCYLDDQTPYHLLRECPATMSARSAIPPDHWTTGNILKAIKKLDFLEILPVLPTP
jgi:ribonuclease HI